MEHLAHCHVVVIHHLGLTSSFLVSLYFANGQCQTANIFVIPPKGTTNGLLRSSFLSATEIPMRKKFPANDAALLILQNNRVSRTDAFGDKKDDTGYCFSHAELKPWTNLRHRSLFQVGRQLLIGQSALYIYQRKTVYMLSSLWRYNGLLL